MILVIIAALVAAAIAYILLSPIYIYINYDFSGKNLMSAGIRLYPFDYKFKVGQKKETQAKAKKFKAAAIGKKQPKKRGIDFVSLIIDELDMLRDILVNLFALIIGLAKSPDRYFAHINLGGGLGTPDLTGQFYGGLQMIRPALGNSVTIIYRPDFLAESLTGQATVGLVVRIYNILKELFFFQQLTYNEYTSSVSCSKSRKTCFIAAVFPIPGAPKTKTFLPFFPCSNGFMEFAIYLC